MNRSLLIGIIATIALFSGIAIYFYIHNIKGKNKPAISAVPNDACFIFQTRNLVNSWENIEKSNLWIDLKTNAQLAGASAKLNQLIGVVKANEDFLELLSENTTALSIHNSNNSINFLAIVETGKEMNPAELAKYFASAYKGIMLKRNFEKIPVYDVIDQNGINLVSFSFKENLLLCSPDVNLIEESLRKIKYQLPNATKGFEQVSLLAETGADANVFVNYQKLPLFFNHFTKAEYSGIFNYLKKLANWSMLDITLDKDQFKLSGVTYTDDSLFQFLDLFKNQTPKPLALQQYMPQTTSMAVQMGFSDYLKFNSELNEYLEIHQKSTEYDKFQDSLETRYGIDLTQKVIPFIDGEAALVMTEPAGSDFMQNLSAIIRFKDPSAMAQSLKSFVAAMNQKGETDSVSYFHNGAEIERIKLGNFLKIYYGEIMENITMPYYTQLNDVFVFANSESTLKFMIDEYKKGTTLANHEKYKAYANGLSANNNVNVFISPSRNFLLPSNFVTDTFFSMLNSNQYDFKKMEFFNIQFANTNNKAFYTQVHYKYNTVNTNETQFLWASKLDTTLATVPQVVYNSELKQQVIFVQDVKNTLYCFSTTGNQIWRSKLTARLLGNFITIDAQKNGSTCYLFSTEKQANLIDPNGVSLYHFPINYPGKAITTISLFDFYNDSNPVFFVGMENSRVMGYTLNGQALGGFMPKHLDGKPTTPVASFIKAGKTYLYCTSNKGSLLIFDTKGKSAKTSITTKATYFAHVADNDTSHTYFHAVDTSGNVVKIALDSTFTEESQVSITKIQPYLSIKKQSDPVTLNTYLLIEGKNYWLLTTSNFEKISEVTYTDSIAQLNYFTTDAGGRVMMANFRPQSGAYYWYDMNGKLYIDFPIPGATPFNTANLMQDKGNYLVGGDSTNNIFVYKLK